MEKNSKHNIVRDYIVFSVASFRYYLRIKRPGLFIKEQFRFSRWHQFRNTNEGTLYYQIPWLVFSCIDFLDNWLKPDMKVFEYGSGGSTLYFAQKADKLFSIEHDPEWYLITKTAIEERNINNIEYSLFEPETDDAFHKKDILASENCLSSRIEFSNKNFTNYVKSIDRFQNNYFDAVIVDGRARQSCIAYSIPKIKKGGILLLDNAERNYYIETNPEMEDAEKWRRLDFIGHFPFAPASVLNKTSVFIKQY